MKPLLLDTSYVIALEASDDQNHKAASEHWADLLTSLPPLVTTSYVFNEVITFFNTRNHHMKALEIGNNIFLSALVELIHVDESLFYEGSRVYNFLVSC